MLNDFTERMCINCSNDSTFNDQKGCMWEYLCNGMAGQLPLARLKCWQELEVAVIEKKFKSSTLVSKD